jgi:hypothetical protein
VDAANVNPSPKLPQNPGSKFNYFSSGEGGVFSRRVRGIFGKSGLGGRTGRGEKDKSQSKQTEARRLRALERQKTQ